MIADEDQQHIKHIRHYISRTVDEFRMYKFKNFMASLTDSSSLYLTLQFDNGNQYKLELFYTFDKNDENDVEAVLHIYENDTKLQSYFGSVNEIYTIIHKNQARRPAYSSYYPFQKSLQEEISSILSSEILFPTT